jgi:hypothetical protein
MKNAQSGLYGNGSAMKLTPKGMLFQAGMSFAKGISGSRKTSLRYALNSDGIPIIPVFLIFRILLPDGLRLIPWKALTF